MKVNVKKIMVLTLMTTFLGTSISSLADEIESRRLSVIKVTGENATVIRNNKRSVPAAEGVNLGQGTSVRTGKESNVYIEADNDKILKLDENTLVEISKASAKSLKLTLENGQLFFNVDKPLASDEELTFDAAQTSMSIRGTCGIINMDAQTLQFRLVEGAVEWSLGDQVLRVTPGQEVELERFWGDQKPGPGADKIYQLKSVDNYQWTDLDLDTLTLILEHKDKIELSAIGLGTEEQLGAATEYVEAEQERIRLEHEAAERRRQEREEAEEDEEDNTPTQAPTVEETTTEETTTEEETTASLIPAGKTQGVDGDILLNGSGDQEWVDYEADVNWVYNPVSSVYEWDSTWLANNSYSVLTETP